MIPDTHWKKTFFQKSSLVFSPPSLTPPPPGLAKDHTFFRIFFEPFPYHSSSSFGQFKHFFQGKSGRCSGRQKDERLWWWKAAIYAKWLLQRGRNCYSSEHAVQAWSQERQAEGTQDCIGRAIWGRLCQRFAINWKENRPRAPKYQLLYLIKISTGKKHDELVEVMQGEEDFQNSKSML